MAWPEDAPCRGLTDLFFRIPDECLECGGAPAKNRRYCHGCIRFRSMRGLSAMTFDEYQRSVADRYCGPCPYQQECEDLYQSFSPPPSGVWANKTESDRKAM